MRTPYETTLHPKAGRFHERDTFAMLARVAGEERALSRDAETSWERFREACWWMGLRVTPDDYCAALGAWSWRCRHRHQDPRAAAVAQGWRDEAEAWFRETSDGGAL